MPPKGRMVCRVSAEFHIEGDRALLSLSDLELDAVTLVKVLNLVTRCEAPAMKENFVAPIVGNDKPKALLFYYFLYGSCHVSPCLPIG